MSNPLLALDAATQGWPVDRKCSAYGLCSHLAGIMTDRPATVDDMTAAFKKFGFDVNQGADIWGVCLRALAGETMYSVQHQLAYGSITKEIP